MLDVRPQSFVFRAVIVLGLSATALGAFILIARRAVTLQQLVPTVKPNKIQATIGAICGIVLLFLVLFPPWQEAAEREVAYRKDIGRALLWKPPKTVAVECYFEGCVTRTFMSS